MKENLKFVIVGHVDHGKSTLIGRLLFDTNSLPPDKIEEMQKTSKELGRETEFAYLVDHLREEREQSITIDTTQIFFKTDKREYVIIDAPGHVEFVKNMVTGASQAEAAILIVDTAEGVQEQTRRHAYILSLLGISQIIVVLNKIDLVEFSENRFREVKDETQKFLASINLKSDYYIPISALKGNNVVRKSKKLLWYQGPTLLESLNFLKNSPSPEDKPLIFPLQDIYKIGDKRIGVGRIEAGTIKKAEKIKVLPGGQSTTVKSIELFQEERDEAFTGESIGITTTEPIFLERGNVICEPDKEPSLTDTFSANLFWMSRKELNKDERIILRCATQEISATVKKIGKRINSSTLEVIEENADKLSNLEVGEVIIQTKKPIAVKKFTDVEELGRFVLMREDNICAGGIITGING